MAQAAKLPTARDEKDRAHALKYATQLVAAIDNDNPSKALAALEVLFRAGASVAGRVVLADTAKTSVVNALTKHTATHSGNTASVLYREAVGRGDAIAAGVTAFAERNGLTGVLCPAAT